MKEHTQFYIVSVIIFVLAIIGFIANGNGNTKLEIIIVIGLMIALHFLPKDNSDDDWDF